MANKETSLTSEFVPRLDLSKVQLCLTEQNKFQFQRSRQRQEQQLAEEC